MVSYEGKWVAVFLRNLVEASEVHIEPKGSVLLFDEEDRSSVRGGGGPEETSCNVLIKKLAKSCKLYQGNGIYDTDGWCRAFFKVNLEIIRTMWRKLAGYQLKLHKVFLYYCAVSILSLTYLNHMITN
jgi:hypothetical protein